MDRPCATFVVVGALLTGSAALAAEGPPHGLGLLAGRPIDDAARGRLQAALADPRPQVRAAAVRVINVSGVGPLVPAVADTLSREHDPAAAFEMIRFLASIRHPQGDADAIAAARRLGKPVHEALVNGLGRQGAAAATHIPALRGLGLSNSTWRNFYRLAASDAGTAGPLGAVLLKEGDAQAWRPFLGSLRQAGVDLDGGQAVAAVRSSDGHVRAATYWHLAIAFDAARLADPSLAGALDEAPEAHTDAVDKTAGFAFEVLSRLRGRAPVPMAAAARALGPALRETMPLDAIDTDGLLKVFDANERKALSLVFFDDEKALDNKRVTPMRRRLRGDAPLVVETPRGFPAGYVADVVQAAGCGPKGWGGLLGGEVSYSPEGRPLNVGLVRRDTSKECLEAARALLVSALAPLGVPAQAGQKALLLLPDDSGFLKCLDEASNVPPSRLDDPSPGGGGGTFKEPRKIRDVKPSYPSAARGMGVQGVVVMEATIAPTGCIQGISLIRGAGTDMDLEAFRAVAGWGYEPALRDGTPVPVFLTVSVRFTQKNRMDEIVP